jgi:hypothetical protein
VCHRLGLLRAGEAALAPLHSYDSRLCSRDTKVGSSPPLELRKAYSGALDLSRGLPSLCCSYILPSIEPNLKPEVLLLEVRSVSLTGQVTYSPQLELLLSCFHDCTNIQFSFDYAVMCHIFMTDAPS